MGQEHGHAAGQDYYVADDWRVIAGKLIRPAQVLRLRDDRYASARR